MIRFEALNQQELVDLCAYFMGERDWLRGELTAEVHRRRDLEKACERASARIVELRDERDATRALCAEAAGAIRAFYVSALDPGVSFELAERLEAAASG